jgi:hypothetical protein
MLVGCGVAAFGGVRHWMVNSGSQQASRLDDCLSLLAKRK